MAFIEGLKGGVSGETFTSEQYAQRIIYVGENGSEKEYEINPFNMARNALQSPEHMVLAGQVMMKMAENWLADKRNNDITYFTSGRRTGWENAERVDDSSLLGRWISGKLSNKAPVADKKAVLQNYGQQMIYRDEQGAETRFILNPMNMIESAQEAPENAYNTARALYNMAWRWHNDEKNKDTGWADAPVVDNTSSLGKWVSEHPEELSAMKQEDKRDIRSLNYM